MNISKNLATGALTFLRPGRDIDHIMLRLAHSALQWTSNHNPLFRPFVHNTTDNLCNFALFIIFESIL